MADRQNRALLSAGKRDDDSAEMLVDTRTDPLKDSHLERRELVSLAGSLSSLTAPMSKTKVKTKTLNGTKNVSFSDVQVRTYELILGDNPDSSFPLSLGWKYNEADKMDLDTYQEGHQPKRPPKVQQEPPIGPDLNTLHLGQVLDPTLFTTSKRIPDNAVDYASSAMVALTLQERHLRLRAQGFSEQSLRQQERRRRVQLALEWSFGLYPKEAGGFPYNTCAFFRHYVL